LAKKEFRTGDLYRKMGEYEAAVISYQKLLGSFYDTPYAPEALYWKATCLRQLDRLGEAKEDFTRFIEKYSNHSLYHPAKKGLEAVTEKLNDRAALDSAKNDTPK
jgi:outer membrane protein assembly factor BamD (BamD/ComL family)